MQVVVMVEHLHDDDEVQVREELEEQVEVLHTVQMVVTHRAERQQVVEVEEARFEQTVVRY